VIKQARLLVYTLTKAVTVQVTVQVFRIVYKHLSLSVA